MEKLQAALRAGVGVLAFVILSTNATVHAMEPPPASEEHELRDNCDRPVPPPPLDGATATQAQLDAAHDAVDDFMHASDHYQSCIRRYIGGREDMQRMTASVLPPWMYRLAQEKIDANQKDKVAVGQAYNDAVKAYHDKHP